MSACLPLASPRNFTHCRHGHRHRYRHRFSQVRIVETAEAAVKEAEAEHARLQKEYQDMCAGVATEKEGSRTLTDQVKQGTPS